MACLILNATFHHTHSLGMHVRGDLTLLPFPPPVYTAVRLSNLMSTKVEGPGIDTGETANE